MKISTLIYSIGQGFKNIRRNKLFSLASIATIAACILLIGIFYALIANFNYMITQAEESVCVTVFFDEGISQTEIDDIESQIKKRAEVSKIEFTSAEEAWEQFKVDYFKDYPDLAEGFKDDNPLADEASFSVYLNDIDMQSSLVNYIEGIDGVRQVNASEITAGALSDFGTLAGVISIAIIIILLAVGIFLISNTVVIGITVRKEEIRIMRLIGATDYFVQSPFIIEGVIIGLIGAVIPLVVLYFIYKNVIYLIIGQFQTITSSFSFLPVHNVFIILAPVALIIGAGIGLIGSAFSSKKHLSTIK